MTEWYMLTIPKSYWTKRAFKLMIERFDIHKWICAEEHGRNGYTHYQARVYTSASFQQLQRFWGGGAHIEKSSEVTSYERKEGHYWSSEDTSCIRSCRFGKPDDNQRRVLRRVFSQSDRGITVWYHPKGCNGKTWLCRYLYERGKGYYCPPTLESVKGIIQYIASGYNGEPIIIIDIPRSWKWSEQIYAGIETIKDGLIYDTRYHATIRDIWGVKVLVMCNTLPNLKKLSLDRWEIIDGTKMRDIDHTKKKGGKKTPKCPTSVSMTEDASAPYS